MIELPKLKNHAIEYFPKHRCKFKRCIQNQKTPPNTYIKCDLKGTTGILLLSEIRPASVDISWVVPLNDRMKMLLKHKGFDP